MLRFAIGRPSCVRLISGSAPRFPTRMTLLTLPAITVLHFGAPIRRAESVRIYVRGTTIPPWETSALQMTLYFPAPGMRPPRRLSTRNRHCRTDIIRTLFVPAQVFPQKQPFVGQNIICACSTECDENVIKSWNRQAEYPKQFLTLGAFTSHPSVAFRRRLFRRKPVYSRP